MVGGGAVVSPVIAMVGHSLSDRYRVTFLKRGMKEELSYIWFGIAGSQIKMPDSVSNWRATNCWASGHSD